MSPSCTRAEVMVIGNQRTTLAALLRTIRAAGGSGRAIADLGTARERCLARGGTDLLVIAPDAKPALAEKVARALRDLDPGLEIVVFGREVLRNSLTTGLHRISELHPTSRAGLGALRRHVAARHAPESPESA